MTIKCPHKSYEKRYPTLPMFQKLNPFMSYSKGEKYPKGCHKMKIKFGTLKTFIMLSILAGLLTYSTLEIKKGNNEGMKALQVSSIVAMIFVVIGAMVMLYIYLISGLWMD